MTAIKLQDVCFIEQKAGIPADQLKLCLEPEAAAVYTMSIPLASVRRLNIGFGKFTHGEKHIVIDVGGIIFISTPGIRTLGTRLEH